MISSISSVNFGSKFQPVFLAKEKSIEKPINDVSEKPSQKDSFTSKTKNMTPEQRNWALVGAGVALIAAGMLLRKLSLPKVVVNPAVKNQLETPKEFNNQYFSELIEKMKNSSNLKGGDAVYCIPHSIFKDVFGQNTENINRIWDYLKVSENGFIVAPAHNTNGVLQIKDFSEFKFVDPKTNTMLAFVNELKNGRLVPFLL